MERDAGRDDTVARGARYEQDAHDYLCEQGLRCLARNVRACGAELDLVMRDRCGTVVFVEVRARRSGRFGGAAGSVDWRKRERLRRAALGWLARSRGPVPPCRFDVIAFEDGRLAWLRNAFGAHD